MTIKTFLMGILFVTFICFFAWIAIIILVDPYRSDWITLTLFYFSFFLWTCGLLLMVNYYLRRLLISKASFYAVAAIAARQAVFMALVFVVALALAGFKMLDWISGSLLVISAVFIESYFLMD